MKRFVFAMACAIVAVAMTLPVLTGCGSKEVVLETGDATQAQQEMLENMTPEERQRFMNEVQQGQQQEVDPITLLPPQPGGQNAQ